MTAAGRGLRAVVLAAAVGLLVTTGGYLVAGASADAGMVHARGPGLVSVTVDIRYSHFHLGDLHVRPGTVVRFVIHNRDPIDHEFVIGPPSVHRHHEHGSESTHPPVPGEVSVGADDTGVTFYRFDHPGRVQYACHLPGHLAYGMTGVVTVDAA